MTKLQQRLAKRTAEWKVPKEMFLHEQYKDVKSNSQKLKDKPIGMQNAVRWFYKSGDSLTREDIEDAYMDAVMNAYENDKPKNDKQIYGHTRTLKFRKSATNLGKNQRGGTPLKGLRPHIGNKYSKDGENLIEKMGYDYKGDLIIGSNA